MSKKSESKIALATVSTTSAKTISKRDFLKTVLASMAFFSLGGLASLFQTKSSPAPTANYGNRPYGM